MTSIKNSKQTNIDNFYFALPILIDITYFD